MCTIKLPLNDCEQQISKNMPRLTATCAATNPGNALDLAKSNEIKSTSNV